MALAVSEFQLVLVQLAADLGIKIGRLLARLDRLDQREALAFITEAYPELAASYLAASGELSLQFYNEQPTVSLYEAKAIDLIPTERLAASGRWSLLQDDPAQALVGSSERAVMDQSRLTILENLAEEYDVPMVEIETPGTRWARQASINACSFCRVMSTRGAVYRSKNDALQVSGRSADLTESDRRRLRQGRGFASMSDVPVSEIDEALGRRTRFSSRREAAKQGKSVGDTKTRQLRGSRKLGDKYHDFCKCTAVPVRPGGFYEPPEYAERWEQDYSDAVAASRKAGNTKGKYGAIDLKAVLREMDRAARV